MKEWGKLYGFNGIKGLILCAQILIRFHIKQLRGFHIEPFRDFNIKPLRGFHIKPFKDILAFVLMKIWIFLGRIL